MLQPLGTDGTVDHAMITAQRDVHGVGEREPRGLAGVRLPAGARTTHRQNTRLRWIDDGRERLHPEHAQIRDGEGAALLVGMCGLSFVVCRSVRWIACYKEYKNHQNYTTTPSYLVLMGCEFVVTSAPGQILDGVGDGSQAERVRTLDDGRDQASGCGHGHTNVGGVEASDRLAAHIPATIHLRYVLQRQRGRLDDEIIHRQLVLLLLLRLFVQRLSEATRVRPSYTRTVTQPAPRPPDD